jgi:hypothetical protein
MALQAIITGSAQPMFSDSGKNEGQVVESLQAAIIDGPGPPTGNTTASMWAWVAYAAADAMLAARKEAK